MGKRELLDSIATLSGSIDVLNRAGMLEEVKTVTKKLMELIEKL